VISERMIHQIEQGAMGDTIRKLTGAWA